MPRYIVCACVCHALFVQGRPTFEDVAVKSDFLLCLLTVIMRICTEGTPVVRMALEDTFPAARMEEVFPAITATQACTRMDLIITATMETLEGMTAAALTATGWTAPDMRTFGKPRQFSFFPGPSVPRWNNGVLCILILIS